MLRLIDDLPTPPLGDDSKMIADTMSPLIPLRHLSPSGWAQQGGFTP
jgi:hypothetical protein